MRILLVAAVALSIAACGARTGLDVPGAAIGPVDAGRPDSGRLDAGRVDACVPSVETCDGTDEDCDGTIDDGLLCYTLDGAPIEAIVTTLCGAEWYGYDAPDPESANPTPDVRVSDRVAVAIVESPSSCGGTTIAVIADRPRDGSGGMLRATFRSAPASEGRLLVGDEPRECSETASGVVECAWVWQPCCTDGALVGPFAGDFCTELTLGDEAGLASLVVIDGPRTLPRPFGATMTLCGRAIPEVR